MIGVHLSADLHAANPPSIPDTTMSLSITGGPSQQAQVGVALEVSKYNPRPPEHLLGAPPF